MVNMALTINALLEAASVDLMRTKFVRHVDPRRVPDMFSAWLHRLSDFEVYQAHQSKPVFDNANHLASFVVNREGDTIFIGVYEILGRAPAPAGLEDHLTGEPVTAQHIIYDLNLIDLLADYRGRLLIDWGPSPRAWWQRASKVTPKSIVELRRHVSEPPFPGFQRFTCDLASVPRLPLGWRSALEQVHGCYVLTHKPSGQLYVGAAYSTKGNTEGFYHRWLDHATTPDPVGLRDIKPEDLVVSILEVTDIVWGSEQALKAEAHWKRVLRPSLNARVRQEEPR
jgi:hypothetical protein